MGAGSGAAGSPGGGGSSVVAPVGAPAQPGSWTMDDQPAFDISDDRRSLVVTADVGKLNPPVSETFVHLEFPLDSPELARFAAEVAAEARRFPVPG